MSTATLVAPKVLQVPPGRVGSFVDDVGEIAERLGSPLVPEQVLAVEALTSYDRRGRWLSVEAGVELPRQNGKTKGIVQPVMLWSCLTGGDLHTWTSHLADTHLASFAELADPDDGLVANNDWLRRRVRSVSYENGHEGLAFMGGARLEFRCRSARRGRGRSGAALFVDEALFLGADAMGAVLPTLATRSISGQARALYASSAAKRESAYLRSLRRRALAGDPTLTWVGWWARGSWSEPGCAAGDCAHEVGTAGCALDDETLWAEANILLGRLTSLDFLRAMRRSLPPLEFGREFLGWEEAGDEAMDLDRWAALADPRSMPLPRPVALAFAVSPGGKSAAVMLVGRRADGLVHVELKEHEAGTAWLAGALAAHQGRLGVPAWHRGGKVPEAAVARELDAAGLRLESMPVGAWATTCAELERLTADGGLRHLGDPRLSAALGAVVRRDAGDGLWEMAWRGSQGDCAPAMALVAGLAGLLDGGAPQFVF